MEKGRNNDIELNEEKTKKTEYKQDWTIQRNHTEGTGRVEMNLAVLAQTELTLKYLLLGNNCYVLSLK